MARGQDFRDSIAPDSLQFKSDHFIMGKKFGRVLFLKDYPNFIKDETIARLCEFPQNLMLSIQIVPVPMEEAVADMQKRVLAVETDITRWQQKQNANHNFSAEPPYEMQQMRQEMCIRDRPGGGFAVFPAFCGGKSRRHLLYASDAGRVRYMRRRCKHGGRADGRYGCLLYTSCRKLECR